MHATLEQISRAFMVMLLEPELDADTGFFFFLVQESSVACRNSLSTSSSLMDRMPISSPASD